MAIPGNNKTRFAGLELSSDFVAGLQSVFVIAVGSVERRVTHPHRHFLKLFALFEHEIGKAFTTTVGSNAFAEPYRNKKPMNSDI